jgi:hypothetical protein
VKGDLMAVAPQRGARGSGKGVVEAFRVRMAENNKNIHVTSGSFKNGVRSTNNIHEEIVMDKFHLPVLFSLPGKTSARSLSPPLLPFFCWRNPFRAIGRRCPEAETPELWRCQGRIIFSQQGTEEQAGLHG